MSTTDKLILDMSIETGLRISDILNIRRGQIAKTMDICESKTKKHKIVTISDELLARLPKGCAFGGASNYAFPSARSPGKHIARSTYHRHLKQACMTSEIDCSAHSARKLYAHNIYAKNYDIYEVQKALNHKYISTTATYMGLDLQELIRNALQHKYPQK